MSLMMDLDSIGTWYTNLLILLSVLNAKAYRTKPIVYQEEVVERSLVKLNEVISNSEGTGPRRLSLSTLVIVSNLCSFS